MSGGAGLAVVDPVTGSQREVPVLVSVNVGMPKDVPWHGKTVHTGVWKEPVAGPRMVRRLNIDGDGQGDTQGTAASSGPCSSTRSSPIEYWRRHFGRDDLGYGNFGENLTVDGLPDDEVCIGDRYRIGEAEFEVTQPRVTCYRVGMRLDEPELPALLVSHHRPGFYMRVITRGTHPGRATRSSRPGPGRARCRWPTPTRCSTCPGRDPREAAGRPERSPPSARAGRARSATCWPRPRRRRAAPLTQTPGRPGPASGSCGSTNVVRESEHGVLDLPRRRRRRRAPGGPRRASTSRCGSAAPGSRPRSAATRCPRRRRRHVPDQRQAGAARRRQQLPEPRPAAGSDPGRGRAPRRLRPRRRHRPGAADLRRHRRHAGPVHAAPARGGPQRAGHLVAVRGTRTARASLRGRGARPARLAAARPRARLLQRGHARRAPPRPRRRRAPHQGGAGRAGHPARRERLHLRAGVVHGRHAGRPGRARRSTRPRSTPSCSGRCPRSTRGSPGRSSRPPHQPPGPPGTGPLVTFARSGITAPFGDDRRSVLDLADACDVPTRWSCRTGVCHTCVTPLLSGDITYAPDPLEPPADGQVLICCARPGTDIVLDM